MIIIILKVIYLFLRQQFAENAKFGDENYRSVNYNQFKNDLEKHLILFLGLNEMKKTKSMSETIDNLSIQIDQHKSVNDEQMRHVRLIQNQIDAYRKASDAEKERLTKEIQKINQSIVVNKIGSIVETIFNMVVLKKSCSIM